MSSKNNPIKTGRTTLSILSALFALLAPATLYAQSERFDPPEPPSLSVLSDAYVFPGVYVSYNIREGYRKFAAADGYLHDDNTNPFIWGASIGRRIPVDNPRLRFQAALEFGWGNVKDGDYNIDLTDGVSVWSEWVSLYSVYWTGGLLAEAHFLFPAGERVYFVSAGLGAHLTYFDTMLKARASGEEIAGGSSGLRGAISPSVNAGGGVEYMINGGKGVCISYNFRFWQSAAYKEVGALFPMGVNYTEFFYSHSIQLQYLLPRRNRD